MPQNPYTPTDFEPLVMEQFKGINTLTTRAGVPDEQMAWCDGFMPIAPRKLRTHYGNSGAVFTAPVGKTIVRMFFDVSFAYFILSDGSVWALQIDTPNSWQIAAPGTLGSMPTLNSCQMVKSDIYVIVVSTNVNGYNIIAPGTPPVFYTPGSVVPGLGTVPTGIFGSAVETYAGHIWVALFPVIIFTAPGSIIDFSTASGGGQFRSQDSWLRSQFTALIASNGFLYLVGDHSINYISGVQTSGSPPTTTFTNQNLDPDIGTIWNPAVLRWGRDIIVPNPMGVYRVSGGSVTKISDMLDGIYATVSFLGSFTPSAAQAALPNVSGTYRKSVFMLLYPFIDPVTGASVRKLLMWDGRIWWTTSQQVTLTSIAQLGVLSTYTAFGTDGTSVYILFSIPSAGFTKTVRSRYWDRPGSYTHNKSANRFWSLWNYDSTVVTSFRVGIDAAAVDRTTGATVENTNTYTITGPSTTGAFTSPPQAIGQQGVLTGMTISTEAEDATLISAAMAPDVEEYRG